MSKKEKRVRPENTTPMTFAQDVHYNEGGSDEAIYTKGAVYDIDNKLVDRWLKRGATKVTDEEIEDLKIMGETEHATDDLHQNVEEASEASEDGKKNKSHNKKNR